MFELQIPIHKIILNTNAYKTRTTAYCEQYFKEHCSSKTSHDILLLYPELPHIVRESSVMKERLSELTPHQRSKNIIFESVRETIEALKLNPSKESREQQKIIAAAVTSLEFGTPDLGLSPRDKKEVHEIKTHLKSWEDKILNTREKAARQTFPQGVIDIAAKHWEEIEQNSAKTGSAS